MRPAASGRAVVALLLLALAFGLTLRLVGLGEGLPYVVGPDEGFEIHRALKLGRGELDLERVGKGGFYYLLFAEYGVYYTMLRLGGDISSPEEFAARFAADPTPFWMIGRISHVAVAGLLIMWTFLLGRRAYGSLVGLFGASLVAVSPLLVERSRHIGVDLPMTLLAVLTIDLAYRVSDPETKSRPLLLGFCLGLATVTKAPAVLLAIPVALALWLRQRASPPERGKVARGLVGAYASAALVAVAFEPGIVANAPLLWSRITRVFGTPPLPSSAALEVAENPSLWIFYGAAIIAALGIGGLVLSVAGLAWAVLKRDRADLLILSFVVPFLITITSARSSTLYYTRYIIPLIPFLALMAGSLLQAISERLPVSKRLRTALAGALAAALLLVSALASMSFLLRELRPDTRIVARRWVEANIPAGSRVFLIGDPLSDSAPNLSLPLRKTDAHFDDLIRRVESESPAKAQILRLRRQTASGVPYELVTCRHFERNLTLEEYRRQGVRFFVLLDPLFSPDALSRDTRHGSEVRESRAALLRELSTYPDARRVLDLDPVAQELKGPGLEIYRLGTVDSSDIGQPDFG